MPTILIGADLCPIGANTSYFEAGNAQALLNDLLPLFESADLSICNLECPLIEQESPIRKTGPVFAASSASIKAIQHAAIDVLSLANNHILDHGPLGLKNTLAVCANAGISTVGAGNNMESARRILIKDVQGVRIGILAVAENEFSIAGKTSPGANPLDLIDFVRNVRAHENDFDFLLVLYHGGDEFHVPSPRVQNICRFIIEMGANAVIVQHPHCLGGYEYYLGGHIVYGQGALIMDEAIYRDSASFHEGFLVKLNVLTDGNSTIEIIPFTQSDPLPGARRMLPDRESQFRQSLELRSKQILDEQFVETEWARFCEKNEHAYVSGLLGHNRILRKLNGQGLIEKLFHRNGTLLGARNIVCCETHREAVETIFNSRLRPQ